MPAKISIGVATLLHGGSPKDAVCAETEHLAGDRFASHAGRGRQAQWRPSVISRRRGASRYRPSGPVRRTRWPRLPPRECDSAASRDGVTHATHRVVSPRPAGRVHRPEDAQAESSGADGSRRAAAFIGHETAGSPREGQSRLATAYARSDRPTLGVLRAHPSNLRSTSSTIRRHRDPDHALLHPQEGPATRDCSVRGNVIVTALRFLRVLPGHCDDRPGCVDRAIGCGDGERRVVDRS